MNFVVGPALAVLCGAYCANAQNAYQQTNLVSDMSGVANHTDPNLVNPWGIAFFPGQPFWIADNNSGFATVYDANGDLELTVQIPAPPGDGSPATPTGTVINATAGFMAGGVTSQFLFDSEDGTISGWNGTGNAILAVDNSSKGAVYKGLALLSPSGTAPYLAATNFNGGVIETFNESFAPVATQGSFTDPNLPAGYAPFNIQQVGNQVFVTYAVQDTAKHDPVNAPGNGVVDIYDLNGNFVKRFAMGGALNSPWGVVQASPSFGAFSNDILIGDFGDGTINAFDSNGNSLGQLKDSTGKVITNGSLWSLVFGEGGTGDSNTLYFTAGLANESHGFFGAIAAGAGNEDFSLTPTPTSGTVTPGGSMNFTIAVTPANGFASAVNFTCSAPTGFACSLNPSSVTPTNGAVNTTLTVTAQTGVMTYGQSRMMGMLLAGTGVFGFFFAGIGRKHGKKLLSLALCATASLLIVGTMLGSTGCGSSSNNSSMNLGTGSIVVTATSGALTHTATVNVTVQ
jgi:uncharacterized protein (TIGR03118 family)